jgi:Flp pilus assembly protein TadG
MRFRYRSITARGMRGERGGVAVEFAIILPVLMLLIFGIIDFGHAWYMRHLMSDASREGARYGTRYQTVAGNTAQRLLPKNLSPTVTNYILKTWGLQNSLPSDASPQVVLGGPAATETNGSVLAGEDFNVTVTATKTWFVLGNLIPSLGDSTTLSVTTTMTCE